MNDTITVFGKPHCVQCTATYRALDRLGLGYEVVDLSKDEIAAMELASRGHRAAPVVQAGGETWSGYRPDLIKALAARVA